MTDLVQPARIEDYVDEACDHLIEDFRDKRVIRGVLATWIRPGDLIEQALLAMLDALNLDTTTNSAGLDVLGAYVGEGRAGRGNEAYKLGIRIRILVNGSRGRPDDLMSIAELFGRPYDFREFQPASFIMYVDQPADAALFADAMRRAKAAGVQMQVSAAVAPIAERIILGSALYPGFGQGPGSVTSTQPVRVAGHARTK